jgi:hypothetical protein
MTSHNELNLQGEAYCHKLSYFYTAAVLVLIFLSTHMQSWWMVKYQKAQFISVMMQCRQLFFEVIQMKGYH